MVAIRNYLGLLGLAAFAAAQDQVGVDWPVHDNNITDLVQWDHHSFFVNGQRLFVFSGEFHYFRIPVPELWRDLLEKVKAAGFNAFSIYNHWGYHNPVPGVLDFSSGAHNFTSIMTLAKELGMYMIIRPGPYINAEANGGGFPLWITTGEYGALRDSDPRYTEAWRPYMTEIAKVIKPHLITNGGNVILYQIENELNGQWEDIENRVGNPDVQEYMQLMEDNARENGIDVPLTHNAPNMFGYSWSKDFSDAKGNVDVVGLDSYPSCWSCNLSECTGTNGEYVAYKVANYYDYFVKQSPTQPNFMPEFQGGSYNPYGGPQGGCPDDIGVDFANMFYRNLIYQRVTAISLYMLYGGTNWGYHGAPVVATSYDYSSPISENRKVWDKYYETKLLTQFTRVAHDLPYTDRLGNNTRYTMNPAITTAELRSPENGAAFYVVMHADSPSSTLETFQLKVNTSAGELTIPQHGGDITINGHQAKILVTDFRFGTKTLLYSTAEVLTYAIIDGKEVLALWVPTGESGEFTVTGVNDAKILSCDGCANVKTFPGDNSVTISFMQNAGISLIGLADGSRVVLLDRSSAYRFWSPALNNDPQSKPEDSIFVQGPYLLRSAVIGGGGNSLELKGDVENATAISVFAPDSVQEITWNGKKIDIKSRENGIITAELSGARKFELPPLTGWKVAEGLPEIGKDYDASSRAWIVANNSETANPTKPAPNNPSLYVDDYGIHAGSHIYRATFSSSPAPEGMFLSIAGGTAFGYSAWLNGDYIGSWHGLSYIDTQNVTFSFENATLVKDDKAENVLTVLMDNTGHDQRSAAVNPRGILNATLTGPETEAAYTFSSWKIAGTAGSDRREVLDPIRGFLAEGGLYGERIGAHLPGFPEKDHFKQVTATAGSDGGAVSRLSVDGAGVKIFRTTVPALGVPQGMDVSVSFRLGAPDASKNRLRALLFVNGYQYGRFIPHIGNQIDFPVPPGVLDYSSSSSPSSPAKKRGCGGEHGGGGEDGGNTIVLMVWSMDAEGAEVEVEWNVDYVHESSFDFGFDAKALRPGWDEGRMEFA